MSTKAAKATEVIATEPTEHPLITAIKGFVPFSSVPLADRPKTGDPNPDPLSKSGSFTAKAKKVLGVPSDHTITWSPVHFDEDDTNRFQVLAKATGVSVDELGATIVMTWFRDNLVAINEIVNDRLAGETTMDELDKKLAAVERQIARLLEAKSRKLIV